LGCSSVFGLLAALPVFCSVVGAWLGLVLDRRVARR
jgi:hypothetical protein